MSSDVNAFLNNSWGHRAETLSGSGSTMAATEKLRAGLPGLLTQYGIASLFDAPCGDGNWISTIDLGSVVYSGGDLVPEFAAAAASNGLSTTVFDIRKDSFPAADLWLCRACWYHLPFGDIRQSVDNWLRSSIRYALVTSHVGAGQSGDIKLGGFRRLNLSEHDYFGLPEPVDRLDDVAHEPAQGSMTEEMLLFRNPNC